MKYTYFVSYGFKTKDSATGNGNVTAKVNSPIDDCNKITEIENLIKEENDFEDVVISNFILLSEEKEND
jgi:hypothetical protein